MKLQTRGISYLLLGLFVLSSSVFAADRLDGKRYIAKADVGYKKGVGYHGPHYKGESRYKGEPLPVQSADHFEILGGPGVSQLSASNSSLGSLGITSSETDKLVQTNADAWNTLAAQLGAGYVHYFGHAQQYSEQVQWFPSIEPELNVYYLSSNSIDGNVLRFGSAAFNDLTFDIPIRSTRVMLDAALTVVSWKKLSIYAIGGIGNAWTRVGYKDTANDGNPCVEQRLDLNDKMNSNFAWEVGAGMTYAFNGRFALSAEYLYASLGNVKTAGSGNTGTITSPVIVPAKFNLRSGAGLLVLHIAL